MSLAATAELTRLARLLRCAPEEVAFLDRFAPAELRALRLAVSTHLQAGRAPAYSRIASASRLVPLKVIVPITERVMPARVAAGVVASLAPEQAAAMAAKMSSGYVADVTTHLAPPAVQPVLSQLPVEVVLRVADELAGRGDHTTMAEVVGGLTDEQLTAVLTAIADPATTVQVALRITDPEAVPRITGVLPEEHLREMVRWARGQARLWPELVALLGRLPKAQRDRLLAAGR